MLTALALWIGAILQPASSEQPSFSRSRTLAIRTTDTSANPLPGVTLRLCPITPRQPQPEVVGVCALQVANDQGRGKFNSILPGHYIVLGELSGFATTAIYPLSIGAEDPIAPDAVVLVLNPVCFHC